jgi:hypothetical protein
MSCQAKNNGRFKKILKKHRDLTGKKQKTGNKNSMSP